MSYILLNGLPWLLRKVSGERVVPSDYSKAEPWVIPPGGIIPVWMFVLLVFVFCDCCLINTS
jgi:AGZA family xanthine/uracil permease-like MFS transporter